MQLRRVIWIALLAAWLGFVAVSGRTERGVAHAGVSALPAACEDAGVADSTLFLIGDAGAPRAPTEPLLDALAAEASERVRALGAERVVIAFLGDNVYPVGLHKPDHQGRAEDERRLDAQLAVVRRSGARGYLVPGNHDWDNGGADGWEAMKRQTRFVAARGASVVPPDGCPGPVSAALGSRLALVFLDTQWWLHEAARPEGDGSGCAETNRAEVERALEATLRDTGDRHAIVLGHHPLRSGGPHGARFGWKEHLFPFREMNRSLWIPVPVLGSIRHVARMLGVSPQDVPSTAYQQMIESIERSFAAAPPLVYASGHDHDLQVLRGGRAKRFEVVSGAGSAPNLSWAYGIPGTLFAAAESGYARLDADASRAVELTIETLDANGTLAPAFRACLTERR
ncbi:MAG: hypothetical protein H6Q91_100 [Deltaproteobacteria bacterium]|nr:hypothetical protein [Deltaproteobacteria bacterium]